MDFLGKAVVRSSKALIKEHLNNPFGTKQQQQSNEAADPTTATTTTTTNESGPNEQQQQLEASAIGGQQNTNQTPSTSAAAAAAAAATTTTSDQAPLTGENGDRNSQFAAIAADADAVAQKAVKGAKNIGTFLFSMANKAGQTVSQTAKQVKQVVENTSILTDFTREQQEFIKEHGGSMQAGELPWANCASDEAKAEIREQVLSLSQDKRNFVRSPPKDANFHFDPKQSYPIALSLLKEDPNLSTMRFELVPKLVSEDTFWCNYFYRVSLLKQMSDRGEDLKRQGWASSRSSSGEGPDEITTTDEVANQGETSPGYNITTAATATTTSCNPSGNANQVNIQQQQTLFNPITSSTIASASVTSGQELESSESRKLFADDDDLKSKLRELNIGSLDDGGGQDDENDKWEEELQRDLQEFELVSGDVSALDEEALDKDIMELKKSTANDSNS